MGSRVYYYSSTPKAAPQDYRFFTHSKPSTKPHPIPQVAVLEAMEPKAYALPLPNLKKTVFLTIQHGLETTLSLYEKVKKLGIPAKNIFASTKAYSNCPEVELQICNMGINWVPSPPPPNIAQYRQTNRQTIRTLWQKCMDYIQTEDIETLIILDEGGRLIEAMPYDLRFECNVAGIEQTRGGLYNPNSHSVLFPVISVAQSAAKLRLESPLIADAVLKKIQAIIQKMPTLKTSKVFGVIGNGAIGSNVVKYLLSEGYKVILYDENANTFKQSSKSPLFRTDSIQHVIMNSGVIIGCTGKDVTKGLGADILEYTALNKTFISCSSEDKEFYELLATIAAKTNTTYDPLSDIVYTINENTSITIVNGGFPVNFDRSPVSVPTQDIQLTRGLLYGSILQALRVARKPIGGGMVINTPSLLTLNPALQKFVVNTWRHTQPEERYHSEEWELFENTQAILAESGGKYYPDRELEEAFAVELTPHFTPCLSLTLTR